MLAPFACPTTLFSLPSLPPPPIKDLGMAGQTKRPTSVVLIRSEKDAEVEGLSELLEEVKALPQPH